MAEFQKRAERLLRSAMNTADLEISSKDNGREGFNFLVQNSNAKQSDVFLKPMDLIAQQSSKVPKDKLGEPKENLLVALVGFIPESSWEIKVFTNGMKVLGEYIFHNQIKYLK